MARRLSLSESSDSRDSMVPKNDPVEAKSDELFLGDRNTQKVMQPAKSK